MKNDIYGPKMFVADLLIVSLWALFAWYEVGAELVMSAMIITRISISFELVRKSRWTLLSTLMFALIYVACIFSMPSSKYVEEPIYKMIYVGLCLCGQSELAIESFNSLDANISNCMLWPIWGIISGWLVLMPIFFSVRLRGCVEILLKTRRLWWYFAFVCAVTLFFLIVTKEIAIFMFALLMSLLPLLYWILFSGKNRQLIECVMCDKILMSYISLMAVFYIAVIIGLYNIGMIKMVASFILPIIIYVIVTRLKNSSLKTAPAIMMGIGGLFFINCYKRPHELVVVFLCIGMFLTLSGLFLTLRHSKNIIPSFLVFIANGFVLPITMLGYNPYAVLKADNVDLLSRYCSKASNGLYEFSENGYLGVRDRYGIVIPPEYTNLYFLEDATDYMVLAVNERNSPDYHLQIFDLLARKYIIPVDGCHITEIKMIGYHKYALLDRNGEQIYTLTLTYCDHYSSKYATGFLHRLHSPNLICR